MQFSYHKSYGASFFYKLILNIYHLRINLLVKTQNYHRFGYTTLVFDKLQKNDQRII